MKGSNSFLVKCSRFVRDDILAVVVMIDMFPRDDGVEIEESEIETYTYQFPNK